MAARRSRLDAARARADTSDWAKARRARTRHLIELGGLVQKAELVELLEDDRATILGALLELAEKLRDSNDGDDPERLRNRWKHRGLGTFAAERNATNKSGGQEGEGAADAASPRPGGPTP